MTDFDMGDFRDFVFAARIIRKVNAALGNGDNCPWTMDMFFDLASSVAAEYNENGQCPLCNGDVHATTSARISSHRNADGVQCPTSGHSFHIAVVTG